MSHARTPESTPAPAARSRRVPWLSGLVIVILAVAVVFAGRVWIGYRIRETARSQIDRGALSEAQRWLARGVQLSAASPENQFLLARLQRQLGYRDRWETVIAALDRSAAAASHRSELRLERRLGALRWGEDRAGGAEELSRLVEQGADRDDAAATLVLGLLDARNPALAQRVLRQWESDCQSPAQLAWAAGVYQQRQQSFPVARERFEDALAIEPEHDNARLGLAETLEQLGDVPLAAEYFTIHLRRWPQSEPALLGLSRCSRRLGQTEVAARLMRQAISAENPSPAVWLEAAEAAYFVGDFKEAARRFEKTDLEGPQLAITLRTAATAKALAGQPIQAQELFDRYLAGYTLQTRRQALEDRVAVDASDVKAAAELRQLLSGQAALPAQQTELPTLSPLFALHCAACHGQSGRGDGPANRHLYPRARNLRSDPYRLVTTLNRFPSPSDIRAVIRNGIPGTAMPAFAELSDSQLDQLAEETYRLRQAGFRSDLIDSFKQLGDELSEEAVADIVSRLGTAGEPIVVPAWPASHAEHVAAGRKLYQHATCDRCHGSDGSGQSELLLLDDRGNPTLPRDLVNDPMKGGDDPAALFARLRLGMPGTPHPANPTLSDEQLTSLVEYCRSIAHSPKQPSTNHSRAQRANRHALQAIQ